MGQRKQLSVLDISKVNKLYNCTSNVEIKQTKKSRRIKERNVFLGDIYGNSVNLLPNVEPELFYLPQTMFSTKNDREKHKEESQFKTTNNLEYKQFYSNQPQLKKDVKEDQKEELPQFRTRNNLKSGQFNNIIAQALILSKNKQHKEDPELINKDEEIIPFKTQEEFFTRTGINFKIFLISNLKKVSAQSAHQL